MPEPDKRLLSELAALLRETGEAHHAAYRTTDGVDPEWAIWYAGYVQAHLAGRLGEDVSRSDLVYLLIRAEREFTAAGSDLPWPEFYARVLLTR